MSEPSWSPAMTEYDDMTIGCDSSTVARLLTGTERWIGGIQPGSATAAHDLT